MAEVSDADDVSYPAQDDVKDEEHCNDCCDNCGDRQPVGKIVGLDEAFLKRLSIGMHSQGENSHNCQSPEFLHQTLRIRSTRSYGVHNLGSLYDNLRSAGRAEIHADSFIAA